LFRQACAPCHGIHGDGKSAAAATLAPAPTNFQLEQPDFNYVLQVLREGVPGTAMPIWKSQLSESDRAAVANYVRSLYELSPSNKK
jgi:cytochrome c oxidase cbb3-type subunit II